MFSRTGFREGVRTDAFELAVYDRPSERNQGGSEKQALVKNAYRSWTEAEKD